MLLRRPATAEVHPSTALGVHRYTPSAGAGMGKAERQRSRPETRDTAGQRPGSTLLRSGKFGGGRDQDFAELGDGT